MANIMTRANMGKNGLIENRKSDHHGEEFFWGILDDCLYSNLKGIEYERKTDYNSQIKGIDIVSYINGNKYIMDEKTQVTKAFMSNSDKNGIFTYTLNNETHSIKTACTPTFCLELLSDKITKQNSKSNKYSIREFNIPEEVFGADKYPGWFIDNHKETTHYVLVWPHNLNEIEIAIVNRQDIFDNLKSRGITSELLTMILKSIKDDATNIINQTEFKADKKRVPLRYYEESLKNEVGEYDAWFTSSVYNLAECPVNLVCRKEFLCGLPNSQHYMIFSRKRQLVAL